MARKPKPVDGVVSDVGDAEPHTSGWRLRFRLNGSWTERYRTTRDQAEELRTELKQRAEAAKVGLQVAPTNLPTFRLRAAETAFHLLDAAQLSSPDNEASANNLITAVERFIADAAVAGKPVTLDEAYRLFIERQKASAVAKKTLKDYERFLTNGFFSKRKGMTVDAVRNSDCHNFVHGQPSPAAKFKSYTCLYSFLNFCTGKNNPYIDPSKDQPWLKRNPINFAKPKYQPHRVESYTLKEIQTLLKTAKENGSLGYFIFRFYSLMRFDETARFLTHGSDWKTNELIDLTNNTIHILAQVAKRGKSRDIPIHPTFRAWIDFMIKHKIGFQYIRKREEAARRSVPEKFGNDGHLNLPRHTALTMHVLHFKNPILTAKTAGTSTSELERKYANVRIDPKDATKFYALTPRKMGWR